MTDQLITLRIVSPERVLLEQQVQSVRFPGEDGLYGVLPRHAPMVSLTQSGLLTAPMPGGETLEYVVHDGFAEVRDNVVTVLTRSAEKPHEIDLDRAREAADRARERLRDRDDQYDRARALAALRRALERERLARRR